MRKHLSLLLFFTMAIVAQNQWNYNNQIDLEALAANEDISGAELASLLNQSSS